MTERLVLTVLMLLAAAWPARAGVTLSGKTEPHGGLVFELRGLEPRDLTPRDAAAWSKFLSVHATPKGKARDAGQPALLGSYEVIDGVLRFRSRFPAERGVEYVASYQAGPGGPTTTASLSLADGPTVAPSTVVTRVSPSAALLPENLLRFYIEFSAPMSRGEAYEHVRLLDGRGRPIDLPFLELGEELWDPSGVRFTLLFDPGRIKTGLKPREEAGPVLESGKSYTLVVDRGWLDAAGLPLKDEFRKPFRAGPADHTPPDPSTWRLVTPRVGTKSLLVVRLTEPLDRGMLRRLLTVEGPDGKPVPGKVVVGSDETVASFAPADPWPEGKFHLVVGRDLEDRAGNSVGRPFEVDVFRKIEPTTAAAVKVPFEVGR